MKKTQNQSLCPSKWRKMVKEREERCQKRGKKRDKRALKLLESFLLNVIILFRYSFLITA